MDDETMHLRTPSLSATDGRGFTVRQVDYLRNLAGASPKALVTRQQYNLAGVWHCSRIRVWPLPTSAPFTR